MKVMINTDGASRGNPGPAAVGAVIRDENKTLAQISHRIGFATNNRAEYIAIIIALEKAIKLGAREVALRADSQLVVQQLKGYYRVKKADLKPLHEQVKKLAGSLDSFAVTFVPRERNREADGLANRALDGKNADAR